MPKSPMTATMKSNPCISSVEPKVSRSWPVTMSSPTAARMNPMQDRRRATSAGLPPPRPMKLEKVRSWMAKNSGGPNLQRDLRQQRGEERDQTIENRAPTKEEVKAAVSAWPPLPCSRHRVAVEGGRHRPGLARDVEQDRGDRAAEERAPVDATSAG